MASDEVLEVEGSLSSLAQPNVRSTTHTILGLQSVSDSQGGPGFLNPDAVDKKGELSSWVGEADSRLDSISGMS